jgi:integrase
VARWSLTEGGKRARSSKTFDLRGDAEWWLSEARRHGEAPDDPYLADYLRDWLAGKRSIRSSTREQYRGHVEDHIVPVLGGYRLGELRRRHVEAFVEDRLRAADKRRTPPKPGEPARPISPATVAKVLITLRSALEAAVPRMIPDNPAAKVETPRVEREPVAAMTPADAAALIAAVQDTWMEHIVRVLLGSGLRLGEATALNQGDVHDGWVGLRRSKTTVRAVRLSADADAAIHAAIAGAPRRGKGEPVFFGPRRRKGEAGQLDRMLGASLTHALPKALEAAGLPRLTPHGLRHGTATLMVARGVPMRMVAEQLGHANPSLTARVYAHVAPDSLAEAVGVLDEAVRRPSVER